MTNLNYNIEQNKNKILINFTNNKYTEKKNILENNNSFIADLSKEKIEILFNKMSFIDGTIKFIFEKKKCFSWELDISGYPIINSRFKNLIPFFLKDKKAELALLPFQKDGYNWLLQSENRILADDMGLGKTLQSLAALQELIFKNNISQIKV